MRLHTQHRWWLVFLWTLVLGLTTAAANPAVEYRFVDYRNDTQEGVPGHWITFSMLLPEGIALSESETVVIDFLQFWIITREAALQADPEAIAATLEMTLGPGEAALLATDLLEFNGAEVAVEIMGLFESLADQNMLRLPQATEIRYRQFIPLSDASQQALNRNAADAFQLPQSVLQSRKAEPITGDVSTSDAPEKSRGVGADDQNDAEDDPGGAEDPAEGDASAEESETRDERGVARPAGTVSYAKSPTSSAVDEDGGEGYLFRMRAQFGPRDRRPDQVLSMNTNNLIASLLSYRSEEGELPEGIEPLVTKDHVLLPLKSPIQDREWQLGNSRSPGGLTYERTSLNLGVVIVTQFDGQVRRLQIETPPIREGVSPTGLLGSGSYPPQEQMVRRYVFQIAKLMELFYNQYGYLPSTVSKLELEGFAHVGFSNPFDLTSSASAVNSVTNAKPGDYYYLKLARNEFLLVGFGTDGRTIITVRQPLPLN